MCGGGTHVGAQVEQRDCGAKFGELEEEEELHNVSALLWIQERRSTQNDGTTGRRRRGVVVACCMSVGVAQFNYMPRPVICDGFWWRWGGAFLSMIKMFGNM